MMKKLFALVLVLTLALAMFAALAEDQWYLEKSIALAERMGRMAGDESYVSLFVPNADIQPLVAQVGAQDYSEPTSARLVSLGGAGLILNLAKMLDEPDFSSLSDEVLAELNKRLPGMLGSYFAAKEDYKWVEVTSVLNMSETFVQPEGFEPCVVLLTYEGEYGAIVSFHATGEETLTAFVTPLKTESVDAALEELPALMKGMLQGMTRELIAK